MIHDISWKEDPSMQIRLRRREDDSCPAKKSHCHLATRLSFSLNPSIRPSLSQQHLHSILTSNLSLYPLRPFSLLSRPASRYLMFLSTLLIPDLHSTQAGGFQRGGDKTSSEDCVCPHEHGVLFESLCHKGCFSQRRGNKKELQQVWRGGGAGQC